MVKSMGVGDLAIMVSVAYYTKARRWLSYLCLIKGLEKIVSIHCAAINRMTMSNSYRGRILRPIVHRPESLLMTWLWNRILSGKPSPGERVRGSDRFRANQIPPAIRNLAQLHNIFKSKNLHLARWCSIDSRSVIAIIRWETETFRSSPSKSLKHYATKPVMNMRNEDILPLMDS